MEKIYYNYLNLQEFINVLPCSGLKEDERLEILRSVGLDV